MSKAVKETIQTIIFILVVVLLVVVYIVYPLNRSKAFLGRVNLDDFSEDSTLVNDPTYYIEAGLPADSFTFEADAFTMLACLKITADSAQGTVILLPADNQSRDSLLPLVQLLNDNKLNVITYDQRASGLTSGKYRGDGQLESKDLLALISTLEIREQIVHPLAVVGFQTGGDAALLAELEESRIQKIVAVDPYLTTKRMQNINKERYNAYWFPFYRTVMWWWYNMRSGYAEGYRDIEAIKSIEVPTLIIVDPKYQEDEELSQLVELSDKNLLDVKNIAETNALYQNIIEFIKNSAN